MVIHKDLVHKDLVAPFGCRSLYYQGALRFANAVERYGVIPTGISCLENRRPGFRLSLCSGEREFEVLVDRDRAKLALTAMHLPRRILAEGGAASEAVWQRFSEIIKGWEDR